MPVGAIACAEEVIIALPHERDAIDCPHGSTGHSQEAPSSGQLSSALHSSYTTLTTDTVLSYVEATLAAWEPLHCRTRRSENRVDESDEDVYLQPGEVVASEEVGDGNLNLVFRLLTRSGTCRAVLKQSLPYVRCVGESWPLTLDRNRLEAETLRVHHRFSPEVTERVLFHDPVMAAMVVEDLSDCVIWRRELIRGQYYPHVPQFLGRYLARVFFYTSDLAQTPASKKTAMQRCMNIEMCGITEDLFFTDPFRPHPRNNYEAAQAALVETLLHDDVSLKRHIAQLKFRFMNCPEAHLHGDLHSGSIFIDAHRVKAIDAEFGFYGPMGFDIGTVIGNLLMNYIALPSLLYQFHRQSPVAGCGDGSSSLDEENEFGRIDAEVPRVAVDLSTAVPATPAALLETIRVFWQSFYDSFIHLSTQAAPAEVEVRDAAFAVPGFAEELLCSVWRDTVGYAGSEMIRRTVGLAHVADLDSILCDECRLEAKEEVLRLGVYLVKNAAVIANVESLEELLVSGVYRKDEG